MAAGRFDRRAGVIPEPASLIIWSLIGLALGRWLVATAQTGSVELRVNELTLSRRSRAGFFVKAAVRKGVPE